MKRRKTPQYAEKVATILAHADDYHDHYYKRLKFNGPSLYFHRQALVKRNSGDLKPQLEYIYAVLPSWGMHRMGGGPKMVDFEVFEKSIANLRQDITNASIIDYRCMRQSDWDILQRIFMGIKVMASETFLVGNSKVMAHLLPNIIPPIDRQYTLKFLYGNTTIVNDVVSEWNTMRSIVEQVFIPIAMEPTFQDKAGEWIANQDRYPWDTSIMKVIDNLIIGSDRTMAAL